MKNNNDKDDDNQEERDRKAAEDHRRPHSLSNYPPSVLRSTCCPLSLISGEPATRIPKKKSPKTPANDSTTRSVSTGSSSPGQAPEGKRPLPSHTTNTKSTGALFGRTPSKPSSEPILNAGHNVSSSSSGPIAPAPKASKAAKKAAAKAKRAPKAPPRKKIPESSDDDDDDDDDDLTGEERKERKFNRQQARLFKEHEDARKQDEAALRQMYKVKDTRPVPASSRPMRERNKKFRFDAQENNDRPQVLSKGPKKKKRDPPKDSPSSSLEEDPSPDQADLAPTLDQAPHLVEEESRPRSSKPRRTSSTRPLPPKALPPPLRRTKSAFLP